MILNDFQLFFTNSWPCSIILNKTRNIFSAPAPDCLCPAGLPSWSCYLLLNRTSPNILPVSKILFPGSLRNRHSKCLYHHNQRMCKLFFYWRKFGALNIQCFVINFLFCLIFTLFLVKIQANEFEFYQCIYKVFLEYFIKILYFLQFKF